jgi:hypothetical protein
VSFLHSALVGLMALVVVAFLVAIMRDGVLDHKSKHPLEARCRHHDGLVMRFGQDNKTCLPKGVGEELAKLNASGGGR